MSDIFAGLTPSPGMLHAPEIRSASHLPELRNHLAEMWKPGGAFYTAFTHTQGRTAHDCALQRAMLRESEMYYVEPDMVGLITDVAPSAPADVRPLDLVIPSDSGLMFFAQPIVGIDAQHSGHGVTVDAITWTHAHLQVLGMAPCLSITSYARHWMLPNDGVERSFEYMAEHVDEYASRVPVPGGRAVWVCLDGSDWPLRDHLDVRASWARSDLVWQSMEEDRRLVTAIFTLLAEEGLTTRVVEPADRATRRRADRAGITAPSDVSVITLRQPRSAPREREDGEPGKNYTHRWTVREHLRWQAVGKGRQERRLTLVRAHTAGPAGAPLVVKDKVNRWVR